ncbi:uncharacterized protein IL334_000389 [Kwoniella shivajii]|uniref:cAMP-independent regulatory protein n=1 Tax=Kwoniella shivajii TaxID=564305 RepID=A0ABZ1CQH6_9TREE|nr:hypothetical protein IL334_000389 [Kwoniella shivajii]
MAAPSPPSTPNLDPPFRGYIESTFDALLVFEAARRGMIPRVTRRLIERERGMVQSGAVFVFDEHESGIKRWTDGLVWSPSRILGNFLIYREVDKQAGEGTPTKPSSTSPPSDSPGASGSTPLARPNTSTAGMTSQGYDSPSGIGRVQPSVMDAPSSSAQGYAQPPPPLGQGALLRSRSASEGGGGLDRNKERQLVGSLTNSYKFRSNGLVKKTMSVSVNGFAQHMVSYYTVQDVMTGKLRSPSQIPELSSLEISQEYLSKQNFRFPPACDILPDGTYVYRSEGEVPESPTSPSSQYAFQSFPPSSSRPNTDYYETMYPQMTSHAPRTGSPRNRSVTVPMQIPLPAHTQSMSGSYAGPSSHGSTSYYDSPTVGSMHYAPSIARQNSNSSIQSSASGAIRPGSSSRRFDPYGSGPGSATSPRLSGGMQFASHNPHRRQSQPIPPENLYSQPGGTSYDIKPDLYNYNPPSTAPSSFSSFYPDGQGPGPSHHHHQQQQQQQQHAHIQSPITSPTAPTFAATPTHGYAAWQPVPVPNTQGVPSNSTSRLLPTAGRTDFVNNPPSSSGSGSTTASTGRPNTSMNGSSAPISHDAWNNVNESTATGGVWDSISQTNNNGQNQNATQNQNYIHTQHDDWTRSNTGTIS